MGIFGKDYDYYLGYALSGGGARVCPSGGFHGIRELRPEAGWIVGTSAGALAGVFYADGFTPEEISELFRKHEFREF